MKHVHGEYPEQVRQAVILAAGRGERLGSLTADQPKCLVEVAGRSLLDWTLDHLRAAGVQRCLIVAGWCSTLLQGRTQNCVVNTEWSSTNMVFSLSLADAWLRREPTLVVYGDCVHRIDVLHACGAPSEADILVPGDRAWRQLWQARFDDPLLDAEPWRERDGRLQCIGGRAARLDDIEAQFMGLMRLTPRGWQRWCDALQARASSHGVDSVRRLDITGALAGLLAAGVPIATLAMQGGWIEIDSPDDLACVEDALARPGWSHDFRPC